MYNKTACFGPSSLDLIRCKPKLSPGKKIVCAYRNELVFMFYRDDVCKQVVQKRQYPYANVDDVIWDKSRVWISTSMRQKQKNLRKKDYLFNTVFLTETNGMLWLQKWRRPES